MRQMPSGLIDEEDRVGSWCDHLGDLREMQVMASVLQAGRIRAAPLPCLGQTAPKM